MALIRNKKTFKKQRPAMAGLMMIALGRLTRGLRMRRSTN